MYFTNYFKEKFRKLLRYTLHVTRYKNRGFILVELLVAITVFGLVMVAASSLFISAISSQRFILASQEILDQTSYSMEYMERALRMARKDDTDGVDRLSGHKVNYEITTSGQGGIAFRNYKDEYQEFFLEDGQLKEDRTGYAQPIPLTSDDLRVILFKIGSSDSWDQNDDFQAGVTLLLEIEKPGVTPENNPKIKVQTTISQRNLDIQY